MARYSAICKLIDKSVASSADVTPITQNLIVSGDLMPYLNNLEYTNTGVDTGNSATVQLDVPPDGTFVRRAPILVDKEAKHNYMIEIQITSDGNAGKLFRGILGEVTIHVEENGGEIITIPLLPLEFVLSESLDSKFDLFVSPKDRFNNLINGFTANQGTAGTKVTTGTIDLPDKPKLPWTPDALSSYHDLLVDIIEKQSLAPTTGGTLTDYYYDFEPAPAGTTPNHYGGRIVEIYAEP